MVYLVAIRFVMLRLQVGLLYSGLGSTNGEECPEMEQAQERIEYLVTYR